MFLWLLLVLFCVFESGITYTLRNNAKLSLPPKKIRDVVIIGSGPAGCTAAIYAGRALLNPLVIAGYNAGGQLMLTSEVENFPGYPAGLSGPKIMYDLMSQAKRFGAEFWLTDCNAIDTSCHPFKISTDNATLFANSVIVATGAESLWLNAIDEDLYKGGDISTCATCDGFLSKGKDVVVIGGGDSAMEEASFVTRFARSVTLIHRRERFRASKVMIERVKANRKIRILTSRVVNQWIGDKKTLSAVKLTNPCDSSFSEILPCQSGFIAIGHKPRTAFLGKEVELNGEGYVKTQSDSTKTTVPGLFACGDVSDPVFKQAVTAAGDGCKAAMEAEKWLDSVRNRKQCA